MIRDLRADEIEARVQSVTEKGCVLLLYKNARCDMNILDETFGSMNWQREHSFLDGKNYCTVSVWDGTKWVSKQDVGTESDTEAEKGQASDAFKRACFNWGIGRELYTSPFIFVKAADCNIVEKNGRRACYDKFEVTDIAIRDKVITGLTVVNAKTRKPVYIFGRVVKTAEPDFSAMDKPLEEEPFDLWYNYLCEKIEYDKYIVDNLEKTARTMFKKQLTELNADEREKILKKAVDAHEGKGKADRDTSPAEG